MGSLQKASTQGIGQKIVNVIVLQAGRANKAHTGQFFRLQQIFRHCVASFGIGSVIAIEAGQPQTDMEA